MNLVNDDKVNKVSIASIGTLASDDIPFFYCGDDNLRLGDLLLGCLRITSELFDFDTKRLEMSLETTDHFLYKGLHWGNVNDLETIEIKLAWIFVPPLGELVENSEHSVIGL